MDTDPLVAAPPTVQVRRKTSLAFGGLYLFTLVLYFRPNDLLPIGTFPVVKIIGLGTLLAFALEEMATGHLFSNKPKELKYILGVLGLMFVSVPLALNPRESIDFILDSFLKVFFIFLVLISVTSTYERLVRLIRLTVICGLGLALGTLNASFSGEGLLVGYRATGLVGGMFENPNDLALALALLIPLGLGLAFITRTLLARLIYLASATAMAAAVLKTYSRGGFLTLLAIALCFLVLFRKHIGRVALFAALVAVAALVIDPSLYTSRMLSIFDSQLDDSGSSAARIALLWRALDTFTYNPKVWFVGIGAGNFHIVSVHEQVVHNSYLELLTEVGLPAFVLYVLFLRGAFKGLAPVIALVDANENAAPLSTLATVLRVSLVAYMVGSFFISVAAQWYLYYIAGYAICLRQVAETAFSSEENLESG